MTFTLRRLFPPLALACALALSCSTGVRETWVGRSAPDFEFTAPDGTTARLADRHGQVVVLDFWGFW